MIIKKTTAKPAKMRRKLSIMSILQWKTTSVCPLAGTWGNRYRRTDGRIIMDPAPCLLLQQRGADSRAVFATYENGVLIAACDTKGYEESSCISGSRTHPYRPGPPPWELLDEEDPAKQTDEQAAAAAKVRESFISAPPRTVGA
jgi:hypothetical protein